MLVYSEHFNYGMFNKFIIMKITHSEKNTIFNKTDYPRSTFIQSTFISSISISSASIKSTLGSISILFCLLLCSSFYAHKVLAESAADTASKTATQKVIKEVIVEANKNAIATEFGLSTFELSGDELTTKMGATLGETLANEPGVHNASYGPGVGLPVLRGLSGVRIRLSEDGIGAWDASSISPDHATAIEPAIAESIRVIKGPATVLHGNNAIGGTVEVNHGRIAESLNNEAFSSIIETSKELVNTHARESYIGKTRAEFGKVVFQFDGFIRTADDMSIPGVAIQEQAIEEVFGISNSDNTFATVLNTDAKSEAASLALSYVEDTFFIGVSSTAINKQYGIPPGAHTEAADSPGHSHSHPVGDNIAIQPRIRINLEQERHLLKLGGQLNIKGLESYRLTVGAIEYTHIEKENPTPGSTAINGTRFYNDVVEVKSEIDHSLFNFTSAEHNGRMGMQWVNRKFMAESEMEIGGEDFIPKTDQQSFGVFSYEQFVLNRASIELGARYEWQKLSQRQATAALLPSNLRFIHKPLTYQTYTLSSAFTFDVSNEHSLILNINSVQRAPEIQELLSLGSHLATRSYDIGLLIGANNPTPEPEKFNGFETRWEWRSDFGEMNTAVFYTEAKDFIYQKKRDINGLFDIADQQFRNACVRLEECIAVFDYTQDNVTLSGYEWQWALPPVAFLGGDFQVELFADYVRGKLPNNKNLPRIPPRRQGIILNWNNNNISSEISYSYVSKQDQAGDNETKTAAYKLLNANLNYTFHIDEANHKDIMVFLKMKNLLNEDIRKSTSFLRNFTPEPGREISLAMRFQF